MCVSHLMKVKTQKGNWGRKSRILHWGKVGLGIADYRGGHILGEIFEVIQCKVHRMRNWDRNSNAVFTTNKL